MNNKANAGDNDKNASYGCFGNAAIWPKSEYTIPIS